MRLHRCAIGIAVLALAACTAHVPSNPLAWSYPLVSPDGKHVTLRYESQPVGAQVVRDGVVLGRTPFLHPEAVNMSHTEEGRIVATCTAQKPVTFNWDSGASTTVQYPCQEFPVVMATRPAEAPGLETDQRVARQRNPARLVYGRRPGDFVAFSGPMSSMHSVNGGTHRPAMAMVSGVGPVIVQAPVSNMAQQPDFPRN